MAQDNLTGSIEGILSAIKEMTAGDPPFVASVRLVCYVPIVMTVFVKDIIINKDGETRMFAILLVILGSMILFQHIRNDASVQKHEKCTEMVVSLCSKSTSVEGCFERVFFSCTEGEGKPLPQTPPKEPQGLQE